MESNHHSELSGPEAPVLHPAPAAAGHNFPSLLRPNAASEAWTINDSVLCIPKVELTLRQWPGPALAHTFGGKPLIELGGLPVFAEVCLYELLRLCGWEARWVEPYGAPAMAPRYLTRWQDAPLTAQEHEPIDEPWVRDLLQQIAEANGGSFAGCWDVVAWQGRHLLFAELKRRGKDRVRATQQRWVAAAQQTGLTAEHFLLVEWDFASSLV